VSWEEDSAELPLGRYSLAVIILLGSLREPVSKSISRFSTTTWCQPKSGLSTETAIKISKVWRPRRRRSCLKSRVPPLAEKFPVNAFRFPARSQKIPCSVLQGISAKSPEKHYRFPPVFCLITGPVVQIPCSFPC